MSARHIAELDETTRYRLLADDQRRFVVESLQPGGAVEITLDELASDLDRAAQRERGVDAPERRNLRCRLHHVHLPMLDDAGILQYDARTKRVRLGEQSALVPAESQ